MRFVTCTTFAALAVPLAACTSPPETSGAGASPPDGGTDAGLGWTYDAPACYFDDDCNYGALDGGSCVAGTCVAHPPGWCLLSSACPAPADLSCASAYCDPLAHVCGIFDKPAGNPCGTAGHACNGKGACAPYP